MFVPPGVSKRVGSPIIGCIQHGVSSVADDHLTNVSHIHSRFVFLLPELDRASVCASWFSWLTVVLAGNRNPLCGNEEIISQNTLTSINLYHSVFVHMHELPVYSVCATWFMLCISAGIKEKKKPKKAKLLLPCSIWLHGSQIWALH